MARGLLSTLLHCSSLLASHALLVRPHVPLRHTARGLMLRGGSIGLMDGPPARRSLEPMPIPTRNTPPTPVERFRKDYAPLPYLVDSVSMNIDIREEQTMVTATLRVQPQASSAGQPLDLDGVDLVLYSVELDGKALVRGDEFELTYDGLRLLEPPQKDFELKTVVAIKPELNTQLSGLYKSGGMYVSHCEAQGFRRITFFQDRPDVMAKYDVRIEADSKYPVLLSNGNEVGSGDAGGGRKWASFSDPFRKPSYLFAAVAGELGCIEDTFTTSSGRKVRLNVWSEPANVDSLDWAMQCLKDSMVWDQDTYGREYDLDVYHVVAVNARARQLEPTAVPGGTVCTGTGPWASSHSFLGTFLCTGLQHGCDGEQGAQHFQHRSRAGQAVERDRH